ncbi:hypothetical protein E2C01_018839 [Portunus trituberculatus]|uniref:Uncharacterized protein n=1 Tax=Portunus trituberculatus TaxID=210409 RepID=A0A5B7DXG0_PORTR|nr:hypothetical protein [Portunus trituberculatus]
MLRNESPQNLHFIFPTQGMRGVVQHALLLFGSVLLSQEGGTRGEGATARECVTRLPGDRLLAGGRTSQPPPPLSPPPLPPLPLTPPFFMIRPPPSLPLPLLLHNSDINTTISALYHPINHDHYNHALTSISNTDVTKVITIFTITVATTTFLFLMIQPPPSSLQLSPLLTASIASSLPQSSSSLLPPLLLSSHHTHHHPRLQYQHYHNHRLPTSQ